MSAQGAPLAEHLQVWLARCLLDRYPDNDIVARLREHGVTESRARQEIRSVLASPVFAAGLQVAARRDKLAALQDALGRQFRQAPGSTVVPVVDRPDRETFFREYYFTNRPVVLRGLMDDWPARTRWTPEYFAERFGDVVVEISDDRDADPRYEDNFPLHRREVTMRGLVALVRKQEGNNSYAVGKNRLLDLPGLRAALDDFTPPDVLHPAEQGRAPSLWFGPAGTVTPLHHDATNILLGQVYGRKRVRLIPPHHLEQVYNDRACFSAVDLDAVDFGTHPAMADVLVVETEVGPGDFLFIPLGWWHWVRSLDVSISLSFQHFRVPGAPVVWRHDPGH